MHVSQIASYFFLIVKKNSSRNPGEDNECNKSLGEELLCMQAERFSSRQEVCHMSAAFSLEQRRRG